MTSDRPAAVLQTPVPAADERDAAASGDAFSLVGTAGFAALCLPVIAAITFAGLFSTAMPLTDEWLFLRAVMRLEEAGLSSVSRVLQLLPYKIYDHTVIVPFLLYWPIAELSNFDNRALLVVTLLCWIFVLIVFRYVVIRSAFWTLPVALILFSPARYMELLWGFQFTLALSILFPILGLAVLSRIQPEDSAAVQWKKSLVSIGLFFIGTLSSAGGFFGFVGAIVLLSFQQLQSASRMLLIELMTAAMLVAYFLLLRDSGQVPVIDLRNVLFILTALGSAVLGMPDAYTQFGLDARSITGAVICFVMVAALITAARHRLLSSISLASGIFVFGLCGVAAIAVARRYLGNWHLVYAIPAVTASYSAAYIVFRERRSLLAAQLAMSAAAILSLGLIAYYTGFTEYGPQYNAYIQSIERYARTYLANPAQAKPYPGTGGWDLDSDMVWFLAFKRHLVFAAEDKAVFAAPRTAVPEATLFLPGNGDAIGNAAHVLVVASLPPKERAAALIFQTARSEVILRKTNPRLIASGGCTRECFTAWVAGDQVSGRALGQLTAVGLSRAK